MHLYYKMACWIRGCTSKRNCGRSKNKSFFTAHTEKMFNNWRDSGIAARGNKFSQKSRICELHFQKDDIVREDIFHTTDGETITVPRKKAKLKEDAVPSIFTTDCCRFVVPKISYYHVNPIYEEKRKEKVNTKETQLKSTVNCSVSVSVKCEPDSPISYHEQEIEAVSEKECLMKTTSKRVTTDTSTTSSFTKNSNQEIVFLRTVLKNTKTVYKNKIRILQHKIRRKDRRIRQLKNILIMLQQKNLISDEYLNALED